MSRANRLLKSKTNITNEESYAFTNPTDAAFISAKIMERNEEKKSVRQTNKIVHAKRKLVENKKTEGQEAKKDSRKMRQRLASDETR